MASNALNRPVPRYVWIPVVLVALGLVALAGGPLIALGLFLGVAFLDLFVAVTRSRRR